MRSSLTVRVILAVALAAIVGVPGIAALDPNPAEASRSAQGITGGEVWTGVLSNQTDDKKHGDDGSSEPSAPLIVRFRPRLSRPMQVNAHQIAGARSADAMALADTVRVRVPASQRDQALAAYNARSDVLYAEPDYLVRALYTPNDPQFPNQWGLQTVGAQSAWDATRGSASIKVAVVDCGVFSSATGRNHGDGAAGHPDLRGRVTANQDFTGSSTGFDDYCDHGTHVAGIVAATGNNGIGISGLAPEVSIVNVKVLDDSGSGYTSTIANGVVWAAQNGAKVINLSLGRDGACSQTEHNAMSFAWSQGAVVVAAAGNSNFGSSGAPANCDNVISVASTTSSDARSWFSNYGPGTDVAAPGSSILSTVRSGGYASYNGTSMASPHVAALAGLLWSRNPSATNQAIVDRIRTTSTQIAGTGSAWAWGRIDASAALNDWGSGPTTGTPTPTSTPPATHTPTPIPPPPAVSCPSPRPPIQVSTAAASGRTLDVSLQAGAGVIRQIEFRELRNASVTIADRRDVTSSFVYRPSTFASQSAFTVAQQNDSQAAMVSLVVTDDCGPWTTFVGGGANSFNRGAIGGIVRNAASGQPISGATVTVRGTQRSATTSSNGTYSLADLTVGNAMLDVSAPGFVTQAVPASVQSNQTTTVNVDLESVIATQEIQVALTWGADPGDLDLHISGPTTSGERFHAYWNNPNAVPHVVVGSDDRNGGGPETIAIRRHATTGSWVPGEYRLWSHNYSGTPGYGSASARITVTRGGQQLATLDASHASGNAGLTIWHAVNLTVDASGNVALVPVQTFTSGGSSTVLRFQDGSRVVEWPAGGKR